MTVEAYSKHLNRHRRILRIVLSLEGMLTHTPDGELRADAVAQLYLRAKNLLQFMEIEPQQSKGSDDSEALNERENARPQPSGHLDHSAPV